MSTLDRLRILHVVGGMNRGGAETWLMHVLRSIDRERFCMDFLVHTTSPCAYDDEIRALGSRVIPCLHPSRPWRYARNLRRVLREFGPYQIVHSHVHHYSGFVLWIARKAGVPVRIAHSHTDTTRTDARAGPIRRVYLRLTERLVRRHATVGLAASRRAAAALFGRRWETDPRFRVLYCGIDLAPFRARVNRDEIRRELGLPKDSFVLGHVGRFHPPKNHRFLLEVGAELVRRVPGARLLLVGDGPLRREIERRVHALGLNGAVVFAGVRADVPRLMRGAMDVFCFPSLYEGLPIVLIEAQAAGIPCVVSSVVPEEAYVIPELTHRLPLEAGAEGWAEALIRARDSGRADSETAIAAVTQSPFSIESSVGSLERIYRG